MFTEGNVLSWATFFPLLGAALIVVLLGVKYFANLPKKLTDDVARAIALVASGLSFAAAIDRYVVDGLVNAVANATLGMGRALRTVQTGRIQTYLYGALGGALVVVLLNFIIK